MRSDLRLHYLMNQLQGGKQARCRVEWQAAWPIAQRPVGLGVEFQEHTVGARCHGGLGDDRHAFAPAAGRATIGTGVSAGQLHGMGGVDGDRHAQTLHLADAQHVDHKVVVAERAAALA